MPKYEVQYTAYWTKTFIAKDLKSANEEAIEMSADNTIINISNVDDGIHIGEVVELKEN